MAFVAPVDDASDSVMELELFTLATGHVVVLDAFGLLTAHDAPVMIIKRLESVAVQFVENPVPVTAVELAAKLAVPRL
jgi:hypothetical protein